MILISIVYVSIYIFIKLKNLASRPFKKVKQDVKARKRGMLQLRVNPNKEEMPL